MTVRSRFFVLWLGVIALNISWSIGYAATLETTPEQFLLLKAKQPIVVDGKLDEWDMADTPYTMSADGGNPRNHVFQNGPTNPVQGDADMSARAAVTWDEKCLYIAGEITDDHLRGVKPDSAGNQGPPGWRCDSLMVDVASFRQPVKSNSPTRATPFIALRYAPQGPNARGELIEETSRTRLDKRDLYWKLPASSQWAAAETERGYNVEAAVPWKSLNYVPRVGERLFIAFLAADVDPGEPLNQIGWAFTGKAKEHPAFRLTDREDVLAILTTSLDDVPADQPWGVRAEMDALSGGAKLEALRVVDAKGEEATRKPIDLAVPAGKTGSVVAEFEKGSVPRVGRYMVEALDGKSTVVACVPVRIVEPTPEPPKVQGLPGQICNTSPDRVAHNAYLEHRQKFYKHDFVRGTQDYVPYIRRWIEPGLKDEAKRQFKEAKRRMHPKYQGRCHTPALRCVALHQITGDDEYAQLARELIHVSLRAQQEEIGHGTAQLLTIYRYLTWMQDPDTPYAPPDAEQLYRQAFCSTAAHPADFYFSEWGWHNRIWHRYAILKCARMVAEEEGQPIDPRVIEYTDYHDQTIAKAGDSDDASSGYHWVFFRKAIMPYFHTGDLAAMLKVKGYRRAIDRYVETVSPSGACAQYGDTSGWPSMGLSMFSYELMSRLTRDGRYRWTAHRIAEYVYNHLYERANQYHNPFDRVRLNFVLSYLMGDDTVKPRRAPSGSRVTWRHPQRPVSIEAMRKRPGLAKRAIDPTKWIPDKVILSSSHKAQDLWGMIDLLPIGGHAGELPGDLICLVVHDAALLAGQGYNDHYPKLANILWIEDLEGLAADPRQMEVEVPIFVDDPAFTFVRIRTERYQHLPVIYTRDVLFYKNGFVIVRDRAKFQSAMKVRVGPCYQTRCLGPQCGAHWFNAYYDQMYFTGLGLGSGVQSLRNPAWDLLIYFCPRPERKHVVLNRYEENPWRCSPIQLRQTWSGMTRPGQELVFSAVLLPHAPVFKPQELLDPPADTSDPKRIEVAVERDDLIVVKAVSEMDPQHKFRYKTWVMINDTGELAEGGPLSSDGLVAVVGHNRDGKIMHRAVMGGEALFYEGTDESSKARKQAIAGLSVPPGLLD